MENANPIRVAVIGLGWVAQHRHIPAIRRNSAFNLVGVIDRHAGVAEKLAAKLEIPLFAESETLDDLAWREAIDAVVIATPPMTHAGLTLQALKQGKHVLCEKPLAMSMEEAEIMAKAATIAGKTLAVVHNFQFSKAMRKLQRDLRKKRLGTITNIAATQLGNPARRLPSWYEKLPMGLFYDESPHFFYLLNALADGPLTLEQTYCLKQEEFKTPRLAHLLYRDGAGVPVSVNCQFDSPISEWHIRVSGTKAVAILDIFRDIYIRLPNDKSHTAFHIVRSSLLAIAQHLFQHIPNGMDLLTGRLDYGNDQIYALFSKAILSGAPAEKIGVSDALEVLKLQQTALLALKEKSSP